MAEQCLFETMKFEVRIKNQILNDTYLKDKFYDISVTKEGNAHQHLYDSNKVCIYASLFLRSGRRIKYVCILCRYNCRWLYDLHIGNWRKWMYLFE